MRAHDFHERLIGDPDLTVPAIARQEQLKIGYLSRLLRLPSLAPDIVTAIINGKHPPQLSAKRLKRTSPHDIRSLVGKLRLTRKRRSDLGDPPSTEQRYQDNV